MQAVATADLAAAATRSRVTLWLCGGSAFLEGFDNQALGVAAPKLFPAFHLLAGQGSLLFSATTAGLAIGAVFGGRLADRYGRKTVLLASIAIFGVFSLLTATAGSFGVLLAARLLTGLGLGGAMPNAIAIAADAAAPGRRLMLVALVTAGLPFGGAISGLLGLGLDAGWSWRSIFFVGGSTPLLLLAAMAAYLPSAEPSSRPIATQGGAGGALDRVENARTTAPPARLEPFLAALFGRGRAVTTVQLWVGFFFLHMILFLLLNWLPSLFVGLGFTRSQGSWSAFWFNICGAAAGVLFAQRQAGATRLRWSLSSYTGMALALAALAFSRSFAAAVLTVALAGTFVIGSQLVLYALAPVYYPPASRATGVGAALTVARCGSVVGPLFAGLLLTLGAGSSGVLLGVLPFVAIAGGAVLLLSRRRYAD